MMRSVLLAMDILVHLARDVANHGLQLVLRVQADRPLVAVDDLDVGVHPLREHGPPRRPQYDSAQKSSFNQRNDVLTCPSLTRPALRRAGPRA